MEESKTTAENVKTTSLIIPGATVFVSSFCIMAIELVAARIIARDLGSSLYTWTAVIGIVLAGISLGNYLGGKIADRFSAGKILAPLFAVSSAACIVVVIINNLAGEWDWLWKLSWPARVFTHVFLVFILPSTLLGTISPVVTKMSLDKGLPAGRTVGTIYAWGAAGSIAGTFAAGFWLIAAMGTIPILWTIGGILLLMGIFYSTRLWPFGIWAIVFLCAMAVGMSRIGLCQAAGVALFLRESPDPRIIYRDQTSYCYVYVKRHSEKPDSRTFVQDKLVHSKIVMGNITDLQYSYSKIYAALTGKLSAGKEKLSVLIIGGGGYVLPRYVEKIWPGSLIEVAEIDPGVTKAATKAFGLEPNTTIKTYTMDARNYVDQLLQQKRTTGAKKLYDFVYGDAFTDYSVPYHLLTKEFNDKISAILADDGIYMLTLIDIYDYGRFLGAVANTLRQTFPTVYILTESRMPKWARNTFVVVASKRQLDLPALISTTLQDLRLWCSSSSDMDYLREKSHGMILTDYYAPVENLLAPVVRQSSKETLASGYIDRAERLSKLGRLEESIAAYKKALQFKPELTVAIYDNLGVIFLQKKDYANAVEVLTKAVEFNQKTASSRSIPHVHFNLAIALQNLKREQEATDQLLKAVQGFQENIKEHPSSAALYEDLGSTLLMLSKFDDAAKAFQQAIALNPDNLSNYVNLVKTLEFQQRYDEAISVWQKAIDYMQQTGRTEDAAEMRTYLEILKSKKQTSLPKEN